MTSPPPPIAYIGNFEPPHSTENHVAQALEALGFRVKRVQEQHATSWQRLLGQLSRYPVVLWTRTAGLSAQVPLGIRTALIDGCREWGVPLVGFHLDRWWDLARQAEIADDPYFTGCALLVTADGGNEERWREAGVEHLWMPPAVSLFECGPQTPGIDLAPEGPIFVGSWQGYHPEHAHRAALVEHLRRRGDVRFYPRPGEHAVRGEALRRLYGSAVAAVGDSCFSGDVKGNHYWSDRVPETLGRGGLLIHPWTHGFDELGPASFLAGVHYLSYPAYDFDALDWAIDMVQRDTALARDVRRAGRALVLRYHTYTVRMESLIWTLNVPSLCEHLPREMV